MLRQSVVVLLLADDAFPEKRVQRLDAQRRRGEGVQPSIERDPVSRKEFEFRRECEELSARLSVAGPRGLPRKGAIPEGLRRRNRRRDGYLKGVGHGAPPSGAAQAKMAFGIGQHIFRVVTVNFAVRAIVLCAAMIVMPPLLVGTTLGATIDPVRVPSLADPALRLDKPDLTGIRAIRFLTSDDYFPLDFALSDGTLTGFNVEIARAICKELEIGCTIQARGWDTLVDALQAGKGDAVIASIASSAGNRARIDFSQPYYQTPARFVARKGAPPLITTPAGLNGRTVGVVGKSSHEAYIKAFFPGAKPKVYADLPALELALRAGEIDVVFADGLTMAVWLNGELSANCCGFVGGPYCESLYFGEGVGIAVRSDDSQLRRALNWALARLFAKGIYSEIYLKYFPIGFY